MRRIHRCPTQYLVSAGRELEPFAWYCSLWSRQPLQEIGYFDHRPRVLLAINKESVSEFGFAFRCRVRVKRSVKVGYLGGGAVGDVIERGIVQVRRDRRQDRLD